MLFLKCAKSVMCLDIELSSAVYTGYVRAGNVPLWEDKDYLLFVA